MAMVVRRSGPAGGVVWSPLRVLWRAKRSTACAFLFSRTLPLSLSLCLCLFSLSAPAPLPTYASLAGVHCVSHTALASSTTTAAGLYPSLVWVVYDESTCTKGMCGGSACHALTTPTGRARERFLRGWLACCAVLCAALMPGAHAPALSPSVRHVTKTWSAYTKMFSTRLPAPAPARLHALYIAS